MYFIFFWIVKLDRKTNQNNYKKINIVIVTVERREKREQTSKKQISA